MGTTLGYAVTVRSVSLKLGMHVVATRTRHVLVAKRSSPSDTSLDLRCRYNMLMGAV